MRSRTWLAVLLGSLVASALGAPAASAQSPPTIAKAFSAATVGLNQSTTLTFTITNPNPATDLTNVTFTDDLPSGLIIANPDSLTPDPTLGNCDSSATTGDIEVTATSISLLGGQIPASATCTFSIDVLAVSSGDQVNTTGAIDSAEGGTGGTATASVTVLGPPTLSAAFAQSVITPSGSTTLTFTLHNPNAGSALSGLEFADPLPAGLVLATPNGESDTCGGTATASDGGSEIDYSGGTLGASATCTIQVSVTGITPGLKNNQTGVPDSVEGGIGDATSATVRVAVPPTASISIPAANALLEQGQALSSHFSCSDGDGGTGIASCVDQGGHGSGAPVDTAAPGLHTLTVSATSTDGLTGSAHATYRVAAPPEVSISGPADGARLTFGQTVRSAFACAEGAGGTGLAACTDQLGRPSGAAIDTSKAGIYALTVTARSQDGLARSRTIHYTVLPDNHFSVRNVRISRTGVFRFDVSIPGAGAVDVLETAWHDNFARSAAAGPLQPARRRFVFARAHRDARASGTIHFTVRPNAQGARLIARPRYRIVLRLWITYTPTGGVAGSQGRSGLHLG